MGRPVLRKVAVMTSPRTRASGRRRRKTVRRRRSEDPVDAQKSENHVQCSVCEHHEAGLGLQPSEESGGDDKTKDEGKREESKKDWKRKRRSGGHLKSENQMYSAPSVSKLSSSMMLDSFPAGRHGSPAFCCFRPWYCRGRRRRHHHPFKNARLEYREQPASLQQKRNFGSR